MQMYGKFDGFPMNSALYGNIMTPVLPVDPITSLQHPDFMAGQCTPPPTYPPQK